MRPATTQPLSAATTTPGSKSRPISKAPGVLVLTDAWHPNWSVRVDGRPAVLGRVDEAFRGVPLPAGRHVVEMTYAPRTLSLGKALSVLGMVLVAAILLLGRRLDPFMLRYFAGTARQR